MACASLSYRTNKNFFQPLLPGFESHLNIPVKFFSDHIEGKHESETVKLRSDASKRNWKVKMEGQRLTEGWKEFVRAHALRVGDFVVFRHKGDMRFHVIVLGPSCCEIQYLTTGGRDKYEETEKSEEEDDENLTAKSHESSSDLNLSVTASNISTNKVCVPIPFAKQNGLDKGSQEILLMNEEGKSWESEVKRMNSGQLFIVRGWTSFCTANKLKVGDSCTLTLLQNTTKPVFRLFSRTKSEHKEKFRSTEEKTGENRFVTLTLSLYSLASGKQYLPRSFTRVNGLNKPAKIILVDKNSVEWSMKLRIGNTGGSMYMTNGNGWKGFCAANEVDAGESLTLELIRGGATPLIKFFSKSPFEAEGRAHKRARVQKRSQETRPKLEKREEAAAEGVSSRRTRSPNQSGDNQGNLSHTQPCSVSDQVAKVKQSVVDSLTSIGRFQGEIETMKKKLEDSLREIDNLGMMCNLNVL